MSVNGEKEGTALVFVGASIVSGAVFYELQESFNEKNHFNRRILNVAIAVFSGVIIFEAAKKVNTGNGALAGITGAVCADLFWRGQ